MGQESTQPTEGREPDVTTDATESAQDATQGDGITDPEVLRSELSKVRQEAAKHRTTARTAGERVTALETQLASIGKALGLESDDPDPNALTTELENVRNELKKERLQNRFSRVATATNADADLTMAYLSHRGQLADLDPEADDFEQQLTQAVKAALEANPKLRQGDTPDRAGAEFGNGTSDGKTRSMNELIRGAINRS